MQAPHPTAAPGTRLRAQYEAALDEAAALLVKMEMEEGVSLEEEERAPADAQPTPPLSLPAPSLPSPPPPPAVPLITRDDLRSFAAELRTLILAAISLAGDGLAALRALGDSLEEVAEGVAELVSAARAARRGGSGGRRGASIWSGGGGGVAGGGVRRGGGGGE